VEKKTDWLNESSLAVTILIISLLSITVKRKCTSLRSLSNLFAVCSSLGNFVNEICGWFVKYLTIFLEI
jgi:hypothetical protein